MFDVGFFELLLIGIVSLLVLGPERLPGTIRTVALWIGRLRRSFNAIKTDIEREIGADEIRRQLRNEEIMEKFKHAQSQVRNTISAVEKETGELKKNLDLEASVGASMNKPAPAVAAPSQDQAIADQTTPTATDDAQGKTQQGGDA